MRAGQIRQRADKYFVPIQTFRPLDPLPTLLLRLVNHLLIQFKEGFYMIGSEGNGNKDYVGLAALYEGLDGIRGLGS